MGELSRRVVQQERTWPLCRSDTPQPEQESLKQPWTLCQPEPLPNTACGVGTKIQNDSNSSSSTHGSMGIHPDQKAMTFHLGRKQPGRGKSTGSGREPTCWGARGSKSQLMLGTCAFGAARRGGRLLSGTLVPWVLGWSHGGGLRPRCHSRVFSLKCCIW